MLLFADQNLLAPNLSTIAKEFHFNDMERDYYLGGHIALGFFVVGAPASYVIGMIADCTSSSSSVAISRSTLFALTIILGEGSCLSTYFVRNYTQLYVTRILTGISVGGAIPIIYSLLGDIFPPHDRPFVTAIVGMGTGCGIALGQGIAGWIGPIYGWRTPFLIISIPAILCAILIALFVPEPQRGCMDSTPPLFNTSTTTTTTSHAELITTTTTNATTTEDTTDTTTIAQYDENTNNHLLKEKEEEHTHLVNILQHMDDPVNDDDAQQQLIQCTKISTAQHTSNNDTQNDHSRFMEEINTMAIHTSHTTYSNHTNNIIVTCYTSTISPSLSLLRIPTVLLLLLQGAPGCIPWGIVNTYLNDYLSTEQHLSIQMATTMLLLFGFGNFVGMSLGGYGGTLLYTKNVRYPHLLSGFSAILSILPLFVLINFTPIANNPSSTPSSSLSPTSSMSSTFYTTTSLLQCNTIIYGIAAIFAGIGSGVTGPIVKATLTNVTIPTSRGTAFALLNTFDDFGRGLGPLFVAILIQSLHGNRQQAFNIGILGWALCGIFNLAIYFFAPTDEQTMRDTLSKYYNDDTIT
jgi:predicted MFS family arabinose efflux permease